MGTLSVEGGIPDPICAPLRGGLTAMGMGEVTSRLFMPGMGGFPRRSYARFDGTNSGQEKVEPGQDGNKVTLVEVATFHGTATGNPYTILTFRSGETGFTKKVGEHHYEPLPQYADLTRAVIYIYKDVYPIRYENNPGLTIERVIKSLSNPRTILELVMHGEEPVGHGIFPRLNIDGESIFYSSRAIKTDYERDGIGTHIFQKAIKQHQLDLLGSHRRLMQKGMIMAVSAYSIRSVEKLKESGLLESMHPYDKPYDQIDGGTDWVFGVHKKVHIHSKGIDTNGVSRKELAEIGLNEAFTPPAKGTRAYEIHQENVHVYGLNPLAGDVMYVGFYIARQPSIAEAAAAIQMPLIRAAA